MEPIFKNGVPFNEGIKNRDYHCLQYFKNGVPFYNDFSDTPQIITGNVKRILKVDWPYVKTIINVEG